MAFLSAMPAILAALWPGSPEPLDAALARFAHLTRPAFELNLSELYGQGGQFTVLHSSLDVRRAPLAVTNNSCNSIDAKGEPTCRPKNFLNLAPADEKMDAITEALNEGRAVPEDLALRAPFLDSRGHSYAAMLVHQGALPFADRAWVASHLAYFTAAELPALLASYSISDPRFHAIADLGESGVKALVQGEPSLLMPDFLFLRDRSRLAFSPLLYRAYPVTALRAFFEGGDYEVVAATPGAFCLERQGNACLMYSSRTALAKLLRYSFAIGLAIALLALLAAAFAWRAFRLRRREEERRRLSLQILSHEFRTPVASALLLVERLAREVLSEPAQDLVTEISAEAHRMQRILETSRNYLSSAGPRASCIRIPAINEWLRELAHGVDPRVQCDLLPVDESVFAEPFWLRLALENLLRNAFVHGAEPVILRARKQRGRVRLTVVDQGHCEFGSLAAMTEPFAKRAASEGLGLGLNITSYGIRQWGGRLDFQASPTSFSFSLPEDARWPGF